MYTTIKVEADGDPNPIHLDDITSLYNGDFTITGFSFPVGDGRNEVTKWDFVLSNDANYSKLDSTICFETALLRLTLERSMGHFFTDSVRIQGLRQIYITEEDFGWVPAGMQSILQFNLLDHYTSIEIFNSINSENRITMEYQDDALLSNAELILSQPVRTIMHVANLESEINPRLSIRRDWQTFVKVTVSDTNDNPIKGANLDCYWPEIQLFNITGTTDWRGECRFASPWLPSDQNQVRFNIKDVTHDVHTYNPKANVDRYPIDPDTNIMIQKPQLNQEPAKK